MLKSRGKKKKQMQKCQLQRPKHSDTFGWDAPAMEVQRIALDAPLIKFGASRKLAGGDNSEVGDPLPLPAHCANGGTPITCKIAYGVLREHGPDHERRRLLERRQGSARSQPPNVRSMPKKGVCQVTIYSASRHYKGQLPLASSLHVNTQRMASTDAWEAAVRAQVEDLKVGELLVLLLVIER